MSVFQFIPSESGVCDEGSNTCRINDLERWRKLLALLDAVQHNLLPPKPKNIRQFRTKP